MSHKSLSSSSGIISRRYSYEFLANNKCVVNADVFRTILDICPRVEGVNFNDVPDDDTTLAFLIKLGYKGPLYNHTNMFVDHMHQPWRTLAAIINKCLSGKTISNDKLRKSRIDILWGMFYRENVNYPELIWEDLAYQIDHRKDKRSRRKDYQEYGLPIPETMMTEVIKQSESYQMFIKYSTGQIPPKKSRGKGSHIKKTANDSRETIDVSEEPEPKPESLGKSISKTKAKEAEAARQVHATHARIVTEYVPEPPKRRKSGKVTYDPPKKLKGVPSLTPEEQEATDIMQALKESKKTSKRQPCIGGSNEGTGTIPGVPNESTVVSATSSEGTEDKLNDEEKDDKEGDADDEDDETESNEDDIYKYKICVCKDEDEEMLNAKVEDSDKGNEEVPDATKADDEKTLEVKDDAKKTELPPTSSSLSVSLGFGDQFLKLSFDSSLVSTVKDTTDAKINSLLEVKIQSEVPHIQSLSVLRVPVSVISAPPLLTPVQESPSIATVTTLPPPSLSTTPSVPQQATTPIPTPTITTDAPIITIDVSESDALSAVQLRVAKLEKDQILELPKKQTPAVDLEQESEKTPSKILKIKREQAEEQKMPKFTIKSTDKAALKEYD
ncbi:hypothetical protein Tco_1001835 [Tanacetum coccineum]